jgi:tagatose 1,6-diphosphate aldolase
MTRTTPHDTPTRRAATLPAGTLRALMTLADDDGRFGMIAVDQRPPIFAAIARHGARRPEEVGYDEVALVKGVLVEELGRDATAVLLDPVWTHPHHVAAVPGRVGLLSTLEDYDFALVDGERRSHPIPHWSVEKIKRSGAQGVKVLVWDRPDVGSETRAHQDAFVSEVGAACARFELPFVLELLVYPFPGEDAASADYARAKPERVIESVRHYAQARFGVDLLKLEFPADLKRTREFAAGAFDGVARDAVYDLGEVRTALRRLDEVASVPWVVLSAGVGPREFAMNVELACEAGASGFLAGRAVWWDALEAYPDIPAMRERLRRVSVPYLRALRAAILRATPWTEHRRFAGDVGVAGASPTWFETYR